MTEARAVRGREGASPWANDGHWRAAATIASGLRSTFNRTEAMLLLDQLHPDMPYWQAVLQTRAHLSRHHSFARRFEEIAALVKGRGRGGR